MIVVFDKDHNPIAETEGIIAAMYATEVLEAEGYEGLYLGVGQIASDAIALAVGEGVLD